MRHGDEEWIGIEGSGSGEWPFDGNGDGDADEEFGSGDGAEGCGWEERGAAVDGAVERWVGVDDGGVGDQGDGCGEIAGGEGGGVDRAYYAGKEEWREAGEFFEV